MSVCVAVLTGCVLRLPAAELQGPVETRQGRGECVRVGCVRECVRVGCVGPLEPLQGLGASSLLNLASLASLNAEEEKEKKNKATPCVKSPQGARRLAPLNKSTNTQRLSDIS